MLRILCYRGSCTALHAPGVNIISAGLTSDTASAVKTGTSMSVPHVSGVAALYLQANPVSRTFFSMQNPHAEDL